MDAGLSGGRVSLLCKWCSAFICHYLTHGRRCGSEAHNRPIRRGIVSLSGGQGEEAGGDTRRPYAQPYAALRRERQASGIHYA